MSCSRLAPSRCLASYDLHAPSPSEVVSPSPTAPSEPADMELRMEVRITGIDLREFQDSTEAPAAFIECVLAITGRDTKVIILNVRQGSVIVDFQVVPISDSSKADFDATEIERKVVAAVDEGSFQQSLTQSLRKALDDPDLPVVGSQITSKDVSPGGDRDRSATDGGERRNPSSGNFSVAVLVIVLVTLGLFGIAFFVSKRRQRMKMTVEGRIGESTLNGGQLEDDIIEGGGMPARRGSGIELNPLQFSSGPSAVVVPQNGARRLSAEAVALNLMETVQRSGGDFAAHEKQHRNSLKSSAKGEQEVISPFYNRGTTSTASSLANGDETSIPARPWQGMLSAPDGPDAAVELPAPVPRTSASRRPWQGLFEEEAGDDK